MGIRNFISDNAVWKFAKRNSERLQKEFAVIMSNDDEGYKFCVSMDKDTVILTIFNKFGDTLYITECQGEEDCLRNVKWLRELYFKEKKVIEKTDKKPDSFDSPGEYLMEFIDDEREASLRIALEDFMYVVAGFDSREDAEMEYGVGIMEAVLDDILRLLLDDFGISVYRPAIVPEKKTGEFVMSEYPYDDIGN